MPSSKNEIGNSGDYIEINPLHIAEFTTVSIRQFRSAPLTLWVFDKNGNKVSVIFDGWLTKGNHSIQWFAEAFDGKRLDKGEYKVLIKNYSSKNEIIIRIV